ncbi:hypothetical protein AB8U03_13930 [Clostridium sp. Mt-5]|uniref:Uncharacterized protein n=1 Tax=Clostridium moutaii TaxID=3240932 RepID=A0ABV4BUT3_9CLOT
MLIEKPKDKQSIYDRQSAVIELAHKIYFRKRFEAEGKIIYLVPSYVPVSLILVQCIILKINKKDRIKNLVIAERYNSDINMLYSILNPILMIEYYWNISVEEWKIKSGDNFQEWIDVIGELEALCSIAVIKYDNPHWGMPGIVAGSSKITAKNMEHPVLEEKSVYIMTLI